MHGAVYMLHMTSRGHVVVKQTDVESSGVPDLYRSDVVFLRDAKTSATVFPLLMLSRLAFIQARMSLTQCSIIRSDDRHLHWHYTLIKARCVCTDEFSY